MEENKRTLDDEIQDLIECLNDLTPNEEDYEKVTKQLETLYKLKIEEEKIKTDQEANKDQNKFRIIGYVLEGAGIVLPLIFYGKWMSKGFEFEETGTYTSKTFMNLQHFFKPTKK